MNLDIDSTHDMHGGTSKIDKSKIPTMEDIKAGKCSHDHTFRVPPDYLDDFEKNVPDRKLYFSVKGDNGWFEIDSPEEVDRVHSHCDY